MSPINDDYTLVKYLESLQWRGSEEELEKLWERIQVCLNDTLSAFSDQLNGMQ